MERNSAYDCSAEGPLCPRAGAGPVDALCTCTASAGCGDIPGGPGQAASDAGYRSTDAVFGRYLLLADLLQEENDKEELAIELVGLCTDICVVSNALLLKAVMPEISISVDASCCAGVTPESHEAALTTMQMCQIDITR